MSGQGEEPYRDPRREIRRVVVREVRPNRGNPSAAGSSEDPFRFMESFISFDRRHLHKITPGFVYTPTNRQSLASNDILIFDKHVSRRNPNFCYCASSRFFDDRKNTLDLGVYHDFHLYQNLFLRLFCLNEICQRRVRRFYELKFSRRLEIFFKNDDIGFGLKTKIPIEKEGFIGEYVGCYGITRINPHSKYLFCLGSANHEVFVDGEIRGNYTRFVNHSCQPNAYMIETNYARWCGFKQVFTRRSIQRTLTTYYSHVPQLWLIAKRRINANEEILIDYGNEFFDKVTFPCLCGTPVCRYKRTW